jgi:hypothetical protein
MKKLCLLIWAIATLASIGGCVAPPRLVNPGGERSQQARARQFDPYPQNFPGLPAATGTRPSEYRDPRAEVLTVQPRKGEPSYPAPAPGPAAVQVQPCPQPR